MVGRFLKSPPLTRGKNVARSPLGFLMQQTLFVGPPGPGLARRTVAARRAAVAPTHARAGDRLRRPGGGLRLAMERPITSRRSIRSCLPPAASLGRRGSSARVTRRAAVAVVAIPGLVAAPTALPMLPPATLGRLYASDRLLAQGDPDRAHEVGAAAIFRRHVRLARNGGRGFRRLSRPATGRARPCGVLRAQLWRGRRARRLRTGARRAAGDQRPQFLFPMGAGGRLGRGRHYDRRRGRRSSDYDDVRAVGRIDRRLCDALRERA